MLVDNDEDTPLKINFTRFVAGERKLSIIQMAQRKLESHGEDNPDRDLLKVFLTMVKHDEQTTGAFYPNLADLNKEKPKTRGVTSHDLSSILVNLPESNI